MVVHNIAVVPFVSYFLLTFRIKKVFTRLVLHAIEILVIGIAGTDFHLAIPAVKFKSELYVAAT